MGHQGGAMDNGTNRDSNMQVATRSRSLLIGRIILDLLFGLVGLPAGIWIVGSGMGDKEGLFLDILIVAAIAVAIWQCIRDAYWTWKRYEELYRQGR